jgi:hypothetical protein
MNDTSTEAAIRKAEASEHRLHYRRVDHVDIRWEPYKPDGRRQMGAKGRWQERVGSGDYWRWQNCERPHALRPVDFDCDAALATARADALREAAAVLLDAQKDAVATMQAMEREGHPEDVPFWGALASHLEVAESDILALIDKEAPDA